MIFRKFGERYIDIGEKNEKVPDYSLSLFEINCATREYRDLETRYYSSDGELIGMVTLEELKEECQKNRRNHARGRKIRFSFFFYSIKIP
jgi:hypothetical protein